MFHTDHGGCVNMVAITLNAFKQGVTTIGIKSASGVVLATERKLNLSLVKNDCNSKVEMLTPNIAMTYSGMGPDFRVLVDRARKLAHTNYKRIYNEYPPVKIMVQELAKVMQESTQSGGIRPFGVSLLVGGYDEHSDKYQLYQVDPSAVISHGRPRRSAKLRFWQKLSWKSAGTRTWSWRMSSTLPS